MAISVVHTTAANTLTVTIPATTAGNCLVVCVASFNATTPATVSGITLGGVADNFAAAVSNTAQQASAFIWCDPNCAGGQTSVVVSGTHLTVSGGNGGIVVYEISGLLTSSVVDKTDSSSAASGISWTSLTTATTAQATEIFIGVADALNPTGPSSPWVNTTAGTSCIAGQQVVSSTGTATYNGSQSNSPWAAAVVTLKGVVSTPVPLTVAQVSIAAPAPGFAASSVALTTAQVNAAAPAVAPGPVIPVIVNQWAATFAQPGTFGPTPPALQSTVIALSPSTSVGGGLGTPTAGNWLFLLAGWNQSGLPGVAIGGADDIHSFWRPGNAAASAWASSVKTGATRAAIWYTANLARVAGDVYAAPSGAVAGMSCLVVEVANLGPWDTVTGISANYSAAATSLGLSLAAPPQPSFTIACVCGDSSAVSQAFAPATWTTLSTVTASNGADHTCDAVLTSAILPSTSGSISVSGTASAASDLAGVILQVQISAPSPTAGTGISPAWPGRMIYEFAPGGGFQTPPDELTWAALSDSAQQGTGYADIYSGAYAAAYGGAGASLKRAWSWNDRGGVPYSLGQLQSGSGACQLDNADGALTPSNAASPFYPDVVTGTPVRLRVALGTMGGVAYNRWYVISRNALGFDEKRTAASRRNYVEAGLTDIWAVVAGTCPTPVRGEIAQDSPYALWPCDDQPLAGGVLPRALANAAPGNGTQMQVTASPAGVTQSVSYGTDGFNFTTFAAPTTGVSFSPGVATYAQPALAGWDYGDPQSSPGSAPTGNPVTASPGAAAWQMSGAAGNTGANGWYLAANDPSFPPVAGGVTVEIWFNYAYFGTTNASNQGGIHVFAGQPYCNLTIWDMTTGSAPVALLQLDRDTGHLNLITWNAGTPTTHAVYAGSDLRGEAWHMATVRLTQSSYAVDVDGGATASVSGAATISASAWSWLVVNGDMGTSGGGTSSAIVHGGNAAFSRIAVYPSFLPAWRVRAHYWASLTGFGLIPAPGAAQIEVLQVGSSSAPVFTPDGAADVGSYGFISFATSSFAFAAVVAAQAGTYHSGPSPWAVQAGYGASSSGTAVYAAWTGVAPGFSVYTSAQVDGETLAATVSGISDTFTAGFGAGATGVGPGQVSGGTGASPPASASALGDGAGQRIERVLGYGGITYPGRAIDQDPLAVQAALDAGGQQTGGNVQNITDSISALMAVDGPGTLFCRMRSHMAADTAAWQLSSAGLQYGIPFDAGQYFGNDPQRVWNDIEVAPYSPDGASLAVITPSDVTAARASQLQYGPQPKRVVSYLQDQSEMQAQADWYLAQFGTLKRRVPKITVNAAEYPAAWALVLNVSPGDLVQVTDQPMQGGPLSTGIFRVSSISRVIAFGANGQAPEASVTLVLDSEPSSWWS